MADKSEKAIKALVDTDFKDADAHFKMVQLLKGLASSKDDKSAKAFLDAVSDALTTAGKAVLSKKENTEVSGNILSEVDSLSSWDYLKEANEAQVVYHIDGYWADMMNHDGSYSQRDLKKMAKEYSKELEKAFSREFPNADIEVIVDLRTSGYRNRYRDPELAHAVPEIADKVLDNLANRKGWW